MPMPQLNKTGQHVIEYLLIFAASVVVAMLALSPEGFLTKGIDNSLNKTISIVDCMARSVCYDPAGCPTVCGNDCCEPGEESTCEEDCGPCQIVDGGWSAWSSWSNCNNCVQTHTRTCDEPSPACGGADCSGPDSEIQACGQQLSGYGAWYDIEPCSAKCDGGTKTQKRDCQPISGNPCGVFCNGPDTQVVACNTQPCFICGDGTCDPAYENCGNCSQDCPPCCGDSVCSDTLGETCFNCPLDCRCCGDSNLDPPPVGNEECDPPGMITQCDFFDTNLGKIRPGFQVCDDSCLWGSCQARQLCGDGIVEGAEICDREPPRGCTVRGRPGFEVCLDDCTWGPCTPGDCPPVSADKPACCANVPPGIPCNPTVGTGVGNLGDNRKVDCPGNCDGVILGVCTDTGWQIDDQCVVNVCGDGICASKEACNGPFPCESDCGPCTCPAISCPIAQCNNAMASHPSAPVGTVASV